MGRQQDGNRKTLVSSPEAVSSHQTFVIFVFLHFLVSREFLVMYASLNWLIDITPRTCSA